MESEIGRLLSLLSESYNSEVALSEKVVDLFGRLLEQIARNTSRKT
jgi:hypothetical protein